MHQLRQVQVDVAEAAIETPGDRSEWGYGYACGVHAGLKMAWDKIVEMHSGDAAKDDEL